MVIFSSSTYNVAHDSANLKAKQSTGSQRLYKQLGNYVSTLEQAVKQEEDRQQKAQESKGRLTENLRGMKTTHHYDPVTKTMKVVLAPPPGNFRESVPTQKIVQKQASKEPISENNQEAASLHEDRYTEEWLAQLTSKLRCLKLKSGGIYLYHTRKAAGTSIRDILSFIASDWHIPYYETEGVVMKKNLVNHHGLLTVTSLRHPISRILSLYWYEHVGWYDGILKQTNRCKTLQEWTQAWLDGSPWKDKFVAKNPYSNYVEIENYYVKMLIGWQGHSSSSSRGLGGGGASRRRVGMKELEEAKAVLRKFDLVLLSEWMGDSTQVEAMNALFPGRGRIAAGHKVRGDFKAKERLTPKLAADEEAVKKLLVEVNKYDLLLYEYAQELMAYRLKLIPPAVLGVKKQLGLDSHMNVVVLDPKTQHSDHMRSIKNQCDAGNYPISGALKSQWVGIFQPPGHKGPF